MLTLYLILSLTNIFLFVYLFQLFLGFVD